MTGAFTLWSLAANSDDNRVAIAEAGGIQSVVEAMGRHKDDATVQQWGCDALKNLAQKNGKKR